MLNNLVIAISGRAGRIGSAFSRSLVENGGKVIIGDVDERSGKQLAKDFGKDNAYYYKCDLTIPDRVDCLIKEGVKIFGRMDAAVHCAYLKSNHWGARFDDLRPDALSEDLFKQLGGAILFSQRMIKYFRKQGHGMHPRRNPYPFY